MYAPPSRRCASARSWSTPRKRVSARRRPSLESARYDLSKVRMESPIDGIETRRNIQEGETAVIGTMNNAGTVLLTLADMSVIQAEVEVDETNIPNVSIGQPAKITIDALPDRTFKGHVSEIGNSPIQSSSTTTSSQTTQATNFKVVVVPMRPSPMFAPVSPARPTSPRQRARTSRRFQFPRWPVRELVHDAAGNVVKQPKVEKPKPGPFTFGSEASTGTAGQPQPVQELLPGQTRKEMEGGVRAPRRGCRIRHHQAGHRRRQVLRSAGTASSPVTRS